MKRRELKKTIKAITECIITDCLATSLYGDEAHRQQASELLPTMLHMQSNYVRRISHVEPGMKAKTYFKDLKSGLIKELNSAADQLGNL